MIQETFQTVFLEGPFVLIELASRKAVAPVRFLGRNHLTPKRGLIARQSFRKTVGEDLDFYT